MPLSKKQIKHLRGLAHELSPVVMVGQHGLKQTIFEELDIALDAHELIKVKVSVGNRAARDKMIEQILHKTHADLAQQIGNIAILFRRNTEAPKVVIPSK